MSTHSAERAVNAYYESEAALRLVATELGALRLLAEAEERVPMPEVEPPAPQDAEAGLMAAFDRALAILVPGYPRTDEEGCDHLVVRRALEFEVAGIVLALTGEEPAAPAPLTLRH
ncbi:MAG: hypothetical protein HY275_02680 [Gemmatimonadetes bacterium]|nr:hypothetical protein [Gemmatimonadota bacterium]